MIAALLAYGAFTVALVLNRSPSDSIGSAAAVIYAIGDLSGESDGGTAVTALLTRHNFDALLTLGDQAYRTGSAEEFDDRYASTYGPFDDRVRPTPGNHDYATPDAAAYFDYFERGSPTFSGDPYMPSPSGIGETSRMARLCWPANRTRTRIGTAL
ncbi:MAG: metallophosphoesterase [Chloroflexota bacterium]|nr:metallophosphoesterase [Chloroflexota bacterium]